MATTSTPTKKDSPQRAPGENDPKLFNTIIVFDVYSVARTNEAARECALKWIREENLAPSEQIALEVKRETEVRQAWREEKPLVADDITDEEFEKAVQGRTTIQIFENFYTKR